MMAKRRKAIDPIDDDPINHQSNLAMCPECDYAGPLDAFECVGACGGNLFCPECACEFEPASGKIHLPENCPECMARGAGWPAYEK